MRVSPLKHPLAVLRTFLGLGQKELSDKVGCSWRTIQAVELQKLPLGVGLGERIATYTGVSLYWLMAGDPEQPMQDELGNPYTRETYSAVQGRKMFPDPKTQVEMSLDLLIAAMCRASAATVVAAESENFRMHAWRLLHALDEVMSGAEDYIAMGNELEKAAAGKDHLSAMNAIINTTGKRLFTPLLKARAKGEAVRSDPPKRGSSPAPAKAPRNKPKRRRK